MTIYPTAVSGFKPAPFIIALILLIVGDIILTVFFFDLVGYLPLIVLIPLLGYAAFSIYRSKTRSLTLTETGISYKKGNQTIVVAFSEVKEVLYTDNYYFANNRKSGLFFKDTTGIVKWSFISLEWYAKDLRALFDAIPDGVVTKSVTEKAF